MIVETTENRTIQQIVMLRECSHWRNNEIRVATVQCISSF